jgi:hypothetical protein
VALTELLLEAEEAVTSAIATHTHHQSASAHPHHKARAPAAPNGAATPRAAGEHGRHGAHHGAPHGGGGDVAMGDDGHGGANGHGEKSGGESSGAGGAGHGEGGGGGEATTGQGEWRTTGSDYLGCQASEGAAAASLIGPVREGRAPCESDERP